MKRIGVQFFLLVTLLLLCTCKKSDTVNSSSGGIHGTITMDVTVMHHTWGVPSIPVYLKYNATDWPGKDTTLYDVKQRANREGFISFPQLGPGNIVIYAAGFDSIFQAFVIGYTTVNLTKNDANSTVNITVTASEKF